MEHQILNLLNEESDSKFVVKKWNTVNVYSNANYDTGNKVIYNAEVIKFNFCDYNDAYILVRSNITIIGHAVTQVAFKNCALFTKCMLKIDGTTVNDGEDLDLVMSIYNLFEYSSNFSDTPGSLWFCSKYEATNFNCVIC